MIYQLPEDGLLIVIDSLLLPPVERAVKLLVVGREPRLTYRSQSPDPPEVVKTSLLCPDGTAMT